jgi:hypothetical protein
VGGSGPDERRDGDEQADTGGDAREAAVADSEAAVADRVAAAGAELYGAGPEAFTERRKALVAEAKTAGDKSAAAVIAALRKPTRAAWVVNRLGRADPGAPARLAGLAAALRAAEQAKDGPRLRELSAERGSLIDALTAQALATAGVPDPPTSLRDEVAATLTAALADPATATEFAAGTLTKAAHWSGFGFGFGGADLAPPDSAVPSADGSSQGRPQASTPGRAPRGAAAKRDVHRQASPSSPAPLPRPAPPAPPARPARQARTAGREQGGPRSRAERPPDSPPDEVAARRAAQRQRAAEEARRVEKERRAAELREQLAREAAERAAERQKNYGDMERTVASAASATAEAEAVEERLEAEVRDLEERLIRARADLAKARLRARHAEAAERRARQVMDRLPRP